MEFTYKDLGIDPKTNALVTDMIAVTTSKEKNTISSIEDLMVGFVASLTDDYHVADILVAAMDMDNKIIAVVDNQKFNGKGEDGDVIFIRANKSKNTNLRILKQLADFWQAKAVILIKEIEKDHWQIIHDGRDDISFSCPHCSQANT